MIVLNYHRLTSEAGQPEATRHWVEPSAFEAQVKFVHEAGLRAVALGHALANQPQADLRIVFTFDDGCDSDIHVAAPLLARYGFSATFYLVPTWIGLPGHLSDQDVWDLRKSGFEIGCHSMTHVRLTALNEEYLRIEIADAKDRLEQLAGGPVRHFACPYGAWSRRIVSAAQSAGFESVATSVVGNNARHNPWALERIAVLKSTDLSQFEAWCRGDDLLGRQLSGSAVRLGVRVLGPARYASARKVLARLGRR